MLLIVEEYKNGRNYEGKKWFTGYLIVIMLFLGWILPAGIFSWCPDWRLSPNNSHPWWARQRGPSNVLPRFWILQFFNIDHWGRRATLFSPSALTLLLGAKLLIFRPSLFMLLISKDDKHGGGVKMRFREYYSCSYAKSSFLACIVFYRCKCFNGNSVVIYLNC